MHQSTQQQKNSNLRLQLWIAIASAIILIAKFVAYFITTSVAILTDALESIVNVAAALIGLYSLYISAKPKDREHPYGHGKAEFISAAVEGTFMLTAGAIIMYKAIATFIHHAAVSRVDMGIYLIGLTAVINWLLGWATLKQGQKNNSLALIASGRHLQTDSYSTAGIIIGLALILFTGWYWIDPVIAALFGLLIMYTGYKIIRKSLAGIMDEADMSLIGNMVTLLNSNRQINWIDMHNLRVIKYGDILHVDCHLTVPWYLTVAQAHQEVDVLGALIRKDFGESLELFVHSDGCEYFQCPVCDKATCPVRQHPFEKKLLWTTDNISQNKRHHAGVIEA